MKLPNGYINENLWENARFTLSYKQRIPPGSKTADHGYVVSWPRCLSVWLLWNQSNKAYEDNKTFGDSPHINKPNKPWQYHFCFLRSMVLVKQWCTFFMTLLSKLKWIWRVKHNNCKITVVEMAKCYFMGATYIEGTLYSQTLRTWLGYEVYPFLLYCFFILHFMWKVHFIWYGN